MSVSHPRNEVLPPFAERSSRLRRSMLPGVVADVPSVAISQQKGGAASEEVELPRLQAQRRQYSAGALSSGGAAASLAETIRATPASGHAILSTASSWRTEASESGAWKSVTL
jgi:hypothetical protein